eukprot:72025_1
MAQLIKLNDLKNIISAQATISTAIDALCVQLPFSRKICQLIVKEMIEIHHDMKLLIDDTGGDEINTQTEMILNEMSSDEVNDLQGAINAADSQLITQLKRAKEIAESKVRSKDKIISAATQKIELLEKELRAIKEEEEREEIQMGNIAKDRARELLQERVQHKQEAALITAKMDETDETNVDEKEPSRDLWELLNESDSPQDATRIIKSRGVLVFEYSNKEKRDIYTLNMNNRYNVLNRLAKEEHRIQFMEYLAHSIVDKNETHHKVEKVWLNNLWLEDKLFVPFMNVILANIQHFYVSEFSVNCSKIFVDGAKKISELIALNVPCLKSISWQQVQRDIPTNVIKDDVLSALEKNTNITKLSLFHLNHHQYRDTKDRILKRNNDIARKMRNEIRRKSKLMG